MESCNRKAVEDGVDILSLSIGPSAVPLGPAAFLNILDVELLLATKAGVVVVQAVGNGGPGSSSVLSFSPWVLSVAASTTDRKYNNSLVLDSGDSLAGSGLSPPTEGDGFYPITAAEDISASNGSFPPLKNCLNPDSFIPPMAEGKLVICSYTSDSFLTLTNVATIANAVKAAGATGFILALDRAAASRPPKEMALSLLVPGILLGSWEASRALWEYYDSHTMRGMDGEVLSFEAMGRILDGRGAIFTGKPPVVASYSSRGPDVNNAMMQTADVLKPNVMAPGNAIWAAWSSKSDGDLYFKEQEFAMVSGTSMATPHVAGVAALIKQNHPEWSPAAVASAIMTTANDAGVGTGPLLAQRANGDLVAATPFDYGSGAINPTRALDPGLIFDAEFKHYIQFLCAVPGTDEDSVRRSAGAGCPTAQREWCSDLNSPSVTVASLVGSRKVERRVTSVAAETEKYAVTVREPAGVAVTVSPSEFGISPNETKMLRIDVVAKEAMNDYVFGEVVLRGDKKHIVRIPLAVYVSSTLML
ncbi:hypothetical protein HPP92_020685 [Vanilla planifolia]|uniref:Subtilisin-like protease n=1 Tax=Vanilla planifolia TaxID=51239 RepID=A0A835UGF2_VANPL|nr:hypothetical protein HPP92_020685 [Vanilla planifolia]